MFPSSPDYDTLLVRENCTSAAPIKKNGKPASPTHQRGIGLSALSGSGGSACSDEGRAHIKTKSADTTTLLEFRGSCVPEQSNPQRSTRAVTVCSWGNCAHKRFEQRAVRDPEGPNSYKRYTTYIVVDVREGVPIVRAVSLARTMCV